jgi:hypothetical protein
MAELDNMLAEQAKQGEQIESIRIACTKIEHCLLGNGKPGLVVRTDRLEQSNVFKTKLFWVVSTAVIAVVVRTVGVDLIGAIAQAGQ